MFDRYISGAAYWAAAVAFCFSAARVQGAEEIHEVTFSNASVTVAAQTDVANITRSSGTDNRTLSVLSASGAISLRTVTSPIIRNPGSKLTTLDATNGSGIVLANAYDVATPITMVKVGDDMGGSMGCGEYEVTGATCTSGNPCVVQEVRWHATTGCNPPYYSTGTNTPGVDATSSGTFELSSDAGGPQHDRCLAVKQGSRQSTYVFYEGC